MIGKMSALLFVLALSAPMLAAAVTVNDVGKTTQSELHMQAQGEHSVPVRPTLKDAAKRAYQRYLKSLEQPIPAHFERQKGMVGGN